MSIPASSQFNTSLLVQLPSGHTTKYSPLSLSLTSDSLSSSDHRTPRTQKNSPSYTCKSVMILYIDDLKWACSLNRPIQIDLLRPSPVHCPPLTAHFPGTPVSGIRSRICPGQRDGQHKGHIQAPLMPGQPQQLEEHA